MLRDAMLEAAHIAVTEPLVIWFARVMGAIDYAAISVVNLANAKEETALGASLFPF